jgi:hypothetical protein
VAQSKLYKRFMDDLKNTSSIRTWINVGLMCFRSDSSDCHNISLTLKVVKKNSPGESCRNRTPFIATGASRNTTSSFEKQKHTLMPTSAARPPSMTLSRSSSRWSQIGIWKSFGSSLGSGLSNDCSFDGSGLPTRSKSAYSASFDSLYGT